MNEPIPHTGHGPRFDLQIRPTKLGRHCCGRPLSNFHGIPRATRDADFLIQLGSASVSDLAAALPDDLGLDSQAAFEAVTGTIRYPVTLRHSPCVCELFPCGDDPHGTIALLDEIRQSTPPV